MSSLAPINLKLSKLIRLFGSDLDGECLGAVRAAQRLLRSAGADWHQLAEVFERGQDDLDEPAGEPATWRALARWVERHEGGRLKPHERAFVAQMVGELVFDDEEPTLKQRTWLRALYSRLRKGGRGQ